MSQTISMAASEHSSGLPPYYQPSPLISENAEKMLPPALPLCLQLAGTVRRDEKWGRKLANNVTTTRNDILQLYKYSTFEEVQHAVFRKYSAMADLPGNASYNYCFAMGVKYQKAGGDTKEMVFQKENFEDILEFLLSEDVEALGLWTVLGRVPDSGKFIPIVLITEADIHQDEDKKQKSKTGRKGCIVQ